MDDSITEKGRIEYEADYKAIVSAIDALNALDSRVIYELYVGGQSVDEVLGGQAGLVARLRRVLELNPELKIYSTKHA